MFKKILYSAAAMAALAFVVQGEAKATTIVAYYSLDGGPVTFAGAGPLSDVLATTFTAGAFTVNIASGTSAPASAPDILTSNVQSTHTGATTDELTVYVLSLGNNPGGSTNFTSSFTQNAPGTTDTGTLSTYLGASTLSGPPFPPTTTLASLDLSVLLGSAVFPPNLVTSMSVTSALASANFSLAAVYDVNATGTAVSNATINISAVPGPIVGAGLPGLIAACGGLLAFARRRRKRAV
jgi:hypothetical protein